MKSDRIFIGLLK